MSEKTLPTTDSKSIPVVDGRLDYSTAAETGFVEIVLPSLPGSPHAEERLLAKDFGTFVCGKIEQSMSKQPYLRSGPRQSPPQIFGHYVSCARGAGLMDSGAIGRMETLAREFTAEPEQQEYFRQVLKPYLFSLTPKRRQ